ncbi:hypothetical protein Golob_008283 [Gossypium lobatum]|uniref:DUF7745 domain-containing protein n=1 Tax=Gossypium lobatum TaxID=34289 RepID=A0A7J8MF20_9ROSI|nr:hypothetical protein [Gossypium lobatum]
MEGYMSKLWDFTRIIVTQNNLQELKEVDKHLFRALAQYWNLAYNCFTFGKVDLVPTVEEYTTLLCCPRIQVDKAYSRAANVPALLKKLMSITGMSEQWVRARIKQKGDSKCITARIKQKGDSKCIPWKSLRDLILAHLDTKKRVDVFALYLQVSNLSQSTKAHK